MKKGRPRSVIPAHLVSDIARRLRQNQSSRTIAKATGGVVSASTIDRKKAEILAAVPEVVPPSTEDDVPEDIPEGTPLGKVDEWLGRIETAAKAAQAQGDYGAMSSLMAKYVALLEHKRKAEPPPKADPNENPDLIAAAARVRERWAKLLDGLAGK